MAVRADRLGWRITEGGAGAAGEDGRLPDRKTDVSDKTTGGPAFPSSYAGASRGMTLRDWFAGIAMQTIYGGTGAQQVADRDLRYDETNWAEIVASNAYAMADAMLKERER